MFIFVYKDNISRLDFKNHEKINRMVILFEQKRAA